MRPEDIFKNITDLMRFSSDISNVSELSGVSTITTSHLYYLENGMLVEIGNDVFQVSNITIVSYGVYTFDITATDITALTWQLALYYEFGRALEIGNTLEDKKADPVNKNKRFPLVWLLTDIQKDYNATGYDYEADITLGFIYLSDANLKAGQRIDTNFEPILDPLVELFKTTINKSPGSRYFTLPYGETLSITETDKFKYGSIAGNKHVFNDITDAIELNMTLKFNSESGNCSN